MSSLSSVVIQALLTSALERGCSDIYFAPGNHPILRRDGRLEPMGDQMVINPEAMDDLLVFFLSSVEVDKFKAEKQITVAYTFGTRARFRVHADYQKGYPVLELRYIPLQVPPPPRLGIPEHVVELTTAHQGLIILAGPLSSGRTTTLASLLDQVNHRTARHIVTIEDPVEFLLNNDRAVVDQRSLGHDVATLDQAFKDLRREDVEVVGIDVALDPNNWLQILNLAGAGALVIAVVEAESTVRALEYITSNWPGAEQENLRNLLADNLIGAFTHRLLPRLGGGRILLGEVLLASEAVRSLIREGKNAQLQSVLSTSRGEGMVSLEYSLAAAVTGGQITADEAKEEAVDQETMRLLLRSR